MIALLRRDLLLALRAGGGFGLGLAFFLIVTVLVPFSVGPQSDLLTIIAPGVLWLGALLACLLSLDRLLALDFEDGTLDLLVTAPLPLEAALSIKALSRRVCLACCLTCLRHASSIRHRHVRCGLDRRHQTRWPAHVSFSAAAVCPNANLRGRGGPPWRSRA